MWKSRTNSLRRPLLPLVLGLSLLSSCAGNIASNACPPLREYSEAFDLKLADEMELLPDDSALVIYAIDHNKLRDEIEACRE